ncbi:alpha/beta fold hydrolase [Sulfitobacter sp. 20_GPM-1509m]|uniref:alpha/beta fold hydrolase n=1 Tax=Sulfitobacter sp. 20_GPM-1509m TaxID=1380367 RepID=UPI00048B00A8|nr:alpha/beta fold hydrolase [Sulfitobacter sp. 20_GPM-1509m]
MLLDRQNLIPTDTTTLRANAAQNGIWFAEQLSPAGYMFNLAEYLSLEGDIDTAVFLETLHWLANEVEASRANLAPDETGLQIQITLHFEGDIPLIDFGHEADPMAAALAWMQSDLADHSRGLWRSALIRLNPRHHLWYQCAHHVLLDGFSGGLLARRCAEIYTARLLGDTPPPSGIAPAKVLLGAENSYQNSPRAGRDRAYWREKLAAVPDPVTLSNGGTRTGGVVSASRQLNLDDSGRLRRFATQSGVSLPQVMVSAFAGYVHRMTGVADLVLAMPVLGRLSRRERAVAMMAANAVALRFDFNGEISFSDLVRQGGQTMMSALRHQKYRFEHVRHDLGLTRADQQVARMAVNFEPFDYALHFGPVAAKVTNLSNGSVDDLTAFVFDRGDGEGLTLTLNANPGLYSQIEVDRHLDRLLRFLREMVARPHAPRKRNALILQTATPALVLASPDRSDAETTGGVSSLTLDTTSLDGAPARWPADICPAQRATQAATDPLTPTEHHLLDRVRTVLDNQDIGIDDDFFQLGGNSLTAARLIAVLRRDYGSDIALTTVFSNPSLRRLAAELDHASGADPLGPVLDLRKADTDAPTVFCLHPIMGIGWGYAALAQALPRRVGICALQSSALTEPDTWPDMQTMARDYVARIRAIQPHGPYYLVGWSFGGLLAHEIAGQLQAQGAQIACLCLLDAYPFQSRMDADTEATQVQQALAFLGEPPDPALHTLDALAEKLVTRPEINALRTTIGKDRFDGLRGRFRDMIEANLDLAQRHMPAQINTPIIDVSATRGKPAALDAVLEWRGTPWDRFTRAGTQRIEVDCGHDDMLGQQSVAAFAPIVQATLDLHDPDPAAVSQDQTGLQGLALEKQRAG